MSDEPDDIYQFLIKRKIPDDTIQILKSEKIDKQVVCGMSDSELSAYLPHHGDRLALTHFCKQSPTKSEKRKQKLMDTLRKKLELGHTGDKINADSDSERKTRHNLRKQKLIGNDNAKKDKRRVDMGWIVKEHDIARQVRTRLGGGTRKIIVKKDEIKCDLIQKGKELFFKHGISRKGSEHEFDFDIWDFAENPIEDNVSVDELYNISKLSTLRVYLATTRKVIPVVIDDSSEESSPKRIKLNRQTSTYTICEETDTTPEDTDLPDPSLPKENHSDSSVLQAANASYTDRSIIAAAAELSGINMINLEENKLEDSFSAVSNVDSISDRTNNIAATSESGKCEFAVFDRDLSVTEVVVASDNITTSMTSLTYDFPVPSFTSSPLTSTLLTNNTNSSSVANPVQSSEKISSETQSLIGNLETHNDTIQFAPFENVPEDLDQTLPYFRVPTRPPENIAYSGSRKSRTVVVHEGNIMKELISFFKDDELVDADINVKRFRPSQGDDDPEYEAGAGSGVIRDVLTEFWMDFYERCTSGCSVKVPVTRHDFQEEEWKSVSRIILKGWLDFGYFPVGISPTIMEECIFGKISSNILDIFFQYLPPTEAVTLKTACENFGEIDKDDLIDVLDSHNGRVLPTEQNIKCICIEIAKKELIHDPRFVVDMWKEILTSLSEKLSLSDLRNVYKSLVPTTKKILSLLRFPDAVSGGQADTILFLKKLVKEMDLQMLSNFMRFCTGSDLLVKDVNSISVTFSHLEGLKRRPVAHTCGCVLELSDNYMNFPEFRSEFNSVLRSGVWVMDIV